MPSATRNAIAFSAIATLVLVVADAVHWQFPIGDGPDRAPFLKVHALFHVGAFIFTFVGAWLGFALLRGRIPSRWPLLCLAALFGVLSFLFGYVAFVLGGLLGTAA